MEIKKLDKVTSITLSANQVITSLTIAVKELIENALDAECTQLGYMHKCPSY